jgi:hydroxymethylbilane synthase
MNKLVIATRGSALALWQSEHIKAKIKEKFKNLEVVLKIFKTKGDIILDTPLALIGGKGLFIKELEVAMLNGDADIAVHSLKDLPTKFEDGLKLSAVTKRESSEDMMLSQLYTSIDKLPKNAIVGTSSQRRRMQLLKYRDDLVIKQLRGNVNTRINKLKNGEYDAIILANAGVKRLNLQNMVNHTYIIPKSIIIPPMGQAALGIETIIGNSFIDDICDYLSDKDATIETAIEREFVNELDGGCQAPIGINCEISGDSVKISAIVGFPDGTNILTKDITIKVEDHKNAGVRLAKDMIEDGAKSILEEAKQIVID